jgi:predicted transposase/invertase (TIGR01784 family)
MAGRIANPHDKFFRSAMAHKSVAIDFFNQHLPEKIRQALDVDSLVLTQQSYIDNDLNEIISDLVFSCQLADRSAYMALLVEHQSSPDIMLSFRIHRYVLGLLHSHLKQHPDQKLPAVYTLVFYHGQTTPYPYSLDLLDCFDDPLGVMNEVLYQPVPLIDVNQLSDDALKQQQWVGPMALAMKHIREVDLAPYALDILSSVSWSLGQGEAVELLQLLVNYLFNAGNIDDINAFIEADVERLSEPVRGEVMTIAEKLKEMGIQEGLQRGKLEGKREGRREGVLEGRREGVLEGRREGMQNVALTMLKEGVDIAFIVKVTSLSVEEVEHLRESLSSKR